MSNVKIKIGGEELDTPYNLRTTETILSTLREEAMSKNTSISVLINQTLYSRVKKYKEKNNLKK